MRCIPPINIVAPQGDYDTLTATDGTQWYRQYAQNAVERKPYEGEEGQIKYEENIVQRLPSPPKRKKIIEQIQLEAKAHVQEIIGTLNEREISMSAMPIYFVGRADMKAERGVKNNTIGKYRVYINLAFTEYAVTKYVKYNPVSLTKSLKKDPQRTQAYSRKELDQLLLAFRNDMLWLVVILAAYYGFRRSEILGLEWSAIDFDEKTITISQVAQKYKQPGKPQVQRISPNVKRPASYRTLPLYPEIGYALRMQQEINRRGAKLMGAKFCDDHKRFVCVNAKGQWLKLDTVTNHYRIVLIRNGIKVLHCHDLRHTFAMLMYNKGVKLAKLQTWLGHSDVQSTIRYTHVDCELHISTMEMAQEILPPVPKKVELEAVS